MTRLPCPTAPDLRQLTGQLALFRLEQDWSVDLGDCVLSVERGFVTDRASSPRGAWPLVGPDDLSDAAAVAHDALYAGCGRPRPPATSIDPARTFSRAQCDRLLLELALGAGVPAWRARGAWLMVRALGWRAWRKHARAIAALSALAGDRR